MIAATLRRRLRSRAAEFSPPEAGGIVRGQIFSRGINAVHPDDRCRALIALMTVLPTGNFPYDNMRLGIQMTYLSHKVTGALLLIAACFALSFQAVAAEKDVKDPRELVEEVAQELFAVAKANPGEKASSEAYFNEVEAILERVVDFPFIAYVVMGESGKKATDEQKQQFAEVFKSGLVRSYAKGIAAYADSDIKILPVSVNPNRPTAVTVKQEVTDKGNVHHLAYSMRLNKKTNEWKLINVTLNGVNLGQSFRSQFSQAIAKQDGDIDKVISNWLSEA